MDERLVPTENDTDQLITERQDSDEVFAAVMPPGYSAPIVPPSLPPRNINYRKLSASDDQPPPLPDKKRNSSSNLASPVSPTGRETEVSMGRIVRQNSRGLAIVHGRASPGDDTSDTALMLAAQEIPEPRDIPGTTPQPLSPVATGVARPREFKPLPPLRRLSSHSSEGGEAGAAWVPQPPGSPMATGDFGPEAGSPVGVIPPKMLEALGLTDEDDSVVGWSMPPDTGAPPPYSPKNQLQRGANKSLKFSQVEVLRREMSHTGGIRVMLRRSDSHHSLALVDVNKKVWIAGWNQKMKPFLQNAFHVGDRIICINGQVVDSAKMAKKLVKYCNTEDKITFIIQRVPCCQVFAIQRSSEGESLGIERVGETPEVTSVQPDGLLGTKGLSNKTPTMDSANVCNWYITEVNNRPLDLFTSGNEIEHRLNAVGKDITIMVQPSDFIHQLKKQMKSVKNYKEYIVH